jgi:tetratricopeptide (TPR) repeat protein
MALHKHSKRMTQNMIGQRSPLEFPVGAGRWDQHWRVAAVCLALAAITFAVFGQTAGFGFVNYDDNIFVYENNQVKGGLSLEGIAWVFTHADCGLYHPLTMLSLMADYQLHGLHAGGYHLTNVLLHAASAILLFRVLLQMTGALWRCAFVAAVFAIHPLRVESVAWVAERKDVLGAFFFMLTLGAYVRYVGNPKSPARYWMVAVAFAMALLSKPTVVTLPFVLLLLDYWPLNRFEPPRKLSGLILEKIPLLALAAGACAMTVLVAGKWITPAAHVSMPARLGNALVYYGVYLRQMVWPDGLAVAYPSPQHGLPPWEIALAGALLAGVSAVAWRERRTRPWLLMGWLWYLGMLTPMIGIVQVGVFPQADRYTYLPQIGICVAITWLVAECRVSRVAFAGLMIGVVGVLMVCAWKQTAYWKDGETLWNHTLGCTTGNYVARLNLGTALLQKGRMDEAITQFQQALQIKPDYADACNNLGNVLMEKGRVDEAIAHYQKALQISPDLAVLHVNLGNALMQKGRVDEAITQFQQGLQFQSDNADAHNNLGNILLQSGRVDEAITQFQQALEIKPDNADAHYNLAIALWQEGRVDEAIAHYQNALQISPDLAAAHINLGNALMQKGKVDEAIAHYQKALQISPDLAATRINLGNALMQKGRVDEAIAHYQKALEIKPDLPEAHMNLGNIFLQQGRMHEAIAHFQKALQLEPADPTVQGNLAWLLATCPDASLRNGNKAVELATRANELTGGENPVILLTLAAAFAETGRFPKAVETAQHALRLAEAQSNTTLAGQLQLELKLYRAGSPFHSPAQTH